MGRTVKPTDPIPSGDCRLEYQYPYGAGYVGLIGASFEPGDEFDCTPEEAAILLAQDGNFVLVSGTPADLTPAPIEETPAPTPDAPPTPPAVPSAPPAAAPPAPVTPPAPTPTVAPPATDPAPAADPSATTTPAN